MLGRDDEASPGLGGGRLGMASDADGNDRKHGERDRGRAVGEPVFSCHGDSLDGDCASNEPIYPTLRNIRSEYADIASRI